MCWKGTRAATPSCSYLCKDSQSFQIMIRRRRSLITHHMDVCPPMWPQEMCFWTVIEEYCSSKTMSKNRCSDFTVYVYCSRNYCSRDRVKIPRDRVGILQATRPREILRGGTWQTPFWALNSRFALFFRDLLCGFWEAKRLGFEEEVFAGLEGRSSPTLIVLSSVIASRESLAT